MWNNVLDSLLNLFVYGRRSSPPRLGGPIDASAGPSRYPLSLTTIVNVLSNEENNSADVLIRCIRENRADLLTRMLENVSISVHVNDMHEIGVAEGQRRRLTCLTYGVHLGHTSCVAALLHCEQTNVNLRHSSDYTALHMACWHDMGDCVALMLAEERMDVNATSYGGGTALGIAIKQNNVNQVLNMLASQRVNLTVRDGRGNTPLHIACQYNRELILRMLCECGVDESLVNMVNKEGHTALHIAVHKVEGEHAKMVKALLDVEGVDVNIRDCDGNTALLLCSEVGRSEVLAMLLTQGGIDVNAINHRQETALSVATPQCKLMLQGYISQMHTDDAPVSPSAPCLTMAEECTICLHNRPTHVFVPCFHLCACGQCADAELARTHQCPICQGEATNVQRVFAV